MPSARSRTGVGLLLIVFLLLGLSPSVGAGQTQERALHGARPSAGISAAGPSVPGFLRVTGSSRTSIALRWTSSRDSVRVSGYRVFVNGVLSGTTSETTANVQGLGCGLAYTLGVSAFDVSARQSGVAMLTAATSTCPLPPATTTTPNTTTTTPATTTTATTTTPADTQPPTSPGALSVTAASATQVSISWTASSDNVAVSSYGVYLDGGSRVSTVGTVYTFTGLACGSSHQLAVDAADAAGNRSGKSSVTAATSACADILPPTTPANVLATSITATGVAVGWNASLDNVGVAGYDVYLGGIRVSSSLSPSYAFTGLTCATLYTIGVDAYDAAGNVSPRATISITTSACPAPPPTTFNVPGTVNDTCATDDTASLLAWFAQVPDGSTLQFGAGKCYRIEGTLELTGRNGLTFNGGGSTFRSLDAMTTGSSTDDQRAMWRIDNSTGITMTNMTLWGAYTHGGTLDNSLQHAHAIDLRGTQANIGGSMTIEDFAGDGIYFGLYGASGQSSGSAHDLTITSMGRQAISFVAANGVTVGPNVIAGIVGYDIYDIEPNVGIGPGVQNVTINGTTINGSYAQNVLAIIEQRPESGIRFTNNTADGVGMKITAGDPNGVGFRPTGITITGNTSNTAQAPTAFILDNADNVLVTGNTIPMTSGMFAASDNGCNVSISGNTYTGGSTQAYITNTNSSCS